MKKINALSFLLVSGMMIFACESKKEETSQQSTDSLSVAAKKDTGAATVFNVDTASTIVKWTGKKLSGDNHYGTIKVKSGQLQIAGNQLTGGSLEIDMTSIKNEDLKDKKKNDKLIGHLKSDDFFGVDKYPTSSFVISNVAPGQDGKTMVTGTLTLKGKTDQVTFPANITVSENKLNASGKFMVDRSKFDVRYGSGKFFENLGDKLINDEIELEFDMKGDK
jgi:polyisoprenoid-binding protein YceI